MNTGSLYALSHFPLFLLYLINTIIIDSICTLLIVLTFLLITNTLCQCRYTLIKKETHSSGKIWSGDHILLCKTWVESFFSCRRWPNALKELIWGTKFCDSILMTEIGVQIQRRYTKGVGLPLRAVYLLYWTKQTTQSQHASRIHRFSDSLSLFSNTARFSSASCDCVTITRATKCNWNEMWEALGVCPCPCRAPPKYITCCLSLC